MLGRFDNDIFLGTGADFADASVLTQAGVEIAVFVGVAESYAHTGEVLQVALELQSPTVSNAALKPLVRSLLGRKLALCGNESDPSFVTFLVGLLAEKGPVSANTVLASLSARNLKLEGDYLARVRALWP